MFSIKRPGWYILSARRVRGGPARRIPVLGSARLTRIVLVLFCGLSALLVAPTAFSEQKVYTVAGGYVGDGKPATSAGLSIPTYAVFDAKGDLIISDSGNCRIRRVAVTGEISTIAGTGICGFSGDNGKAVSAEINFPTGLAIDTGGNLFFSDSDNSRVRKVTPTGTISTVAGNGTVGFCGDGGAAQRACLNAPRQLAVVGRGAGENLIIADTSNHRIREVLGTGIITTVAGNGVAGYSGDGGAAKLASLDGPQGVAIDLAGHALLIADSVNNVIRKVDIGTGIITTLFGEQLCGNDFQSLCNPEGIWVDTMGNLYIADIFNNRVVELPNGSDTAVLEAGTGDGNGFNGDGLPATGTFLEDPEDVTLDGSGNVVIVDEGNSRIRRGSGSQLMTTLAGGFIGDGGSGKMATLNAPFELAFDHAGNLLIADTFDNRIRRVSQKDIISTVAGTGLTGNSGDGGPAIAADLNVPFGVTGDNNGNIYIADTSNSAIRRVDAGGTITTFVNGFTFPLGLTTDSAGNVYEADLNCVVWKFTPDGSGTIVAGELGQCGFGIDGGLAIRSELDQPEGVAMDSQGNLYIADSANNRVQVVNTAGVVNTLAGDGTCGFSGDGGSAKNSMLCFPTSVAVDSANNVYIADTLNFRVRMVDSLGTIMTFAGTGSVGYNGDGLPPLRANLEPESVAVGLGGLIAIEDAPSGRVLIVR
jgi:sugar lactone lactonase YvrE